MPRIASRPIRSTRNMNVNYAESVDSDGYDSEYSPPTAADFRASAAQPAQPVQAAQAVQPVRRSARIRANETRTSTSSSYSSSSSSSDVDGRSASHGYFTRSSVF